MKSLIVAAMILVAACPAFAGTNNSHSSGVNVSNYNGGSAWDSNPKPKPIHCPNIKDSRCPVLAPVEVKVIEKIKYVDKIIHVEKIIYVDKVKFYPYCTNPAPRGRG